MSKAKLLLPPAAAKRPKEVMNFGDARIDNYYWLRDRADPEVMAYLEAENRYADEMVSLTGSLQADLYREMLSRVQEDDSDVGYRQGSHLYYARTEQGKQHVLCCRKKTDAGQENEEVFLDLNPLAENASSFSLGVCEVSPDERWLAYSFDSSGGEAFELRVKDLTGGQALNITIFSTYVSLTWAADSLSFFYVTLDETKRPYRLWRCSIAGDERTLLYEEADERFDLSVRTSSDGEYLLLTSGSRSTSEVLFLSASHPDGAFQVIQPRREGVLYSADALGDCFLIRTNYQAPDFRLESVPIDPSQSCEPREVLVAREGVYLEQVILFRHFLVAFERILGLPQIMVTDLNTTASHYLTFDEQAYTLSPGVNRVFDSTVLRFSYSSLTEPFTTFDYDMSTRHREMKKRQTVPGYDSAEYSAERIFVEAHHGMPIPVSLVYRKGLIRDGENPLLLCGYGAYGDSFEPGFDSRRIALLNRGWIFAIAHVRGGSESGNAWHEGGRLLNKVNTFSDFIDVAEALIAGGCTSPEHLAIQGASAGGMLVGAVLNKRPGLCKAALAQMPFVDVLTTCLDDETPVTVDEFEEWGDPHWQPGYDYIKSYSPYDNIEAQPYPHLLITAGLNDDRVPYWEPAKWAAKLRALKTDNNVLLLKTDLGGGHSGASGRYDRLRETAFAYAFLLMAVSEEEKFRNT